jgi:transmembrane sensor
MPPTAAIDHRLLEEAADWLVRLQTEGENLALQQDIERWRQRSPAHGIAWQRAERVLGSFGQLPPELGRQVLDELPRRSRRTALRHLALAALLAPAAAALWREAPWQSGRWETAVGEQRTLYLEDGTVLVLNTDTLVIVDFNAEERRIQLRRGEILLTTGRDAPGRQRPLRVVSSDGSLRPIGTRFSVRQLDTGTRLAVFEGAVEIATRYGQQEVIASGLRNHFSADGILPSEPLGPAEDAWEKGLLTVNDMPLQAFAAELSRYRRGLLHCHPAVAELRVSGSFPLEDTEAALQLLLKTRPLTLRRLTRFWTILEPRP